MPPQQMAAQDPLRALLGAAGRAGARGRVLLAGAGYGRPRLLLDGDEVAALSSGFAREDAAALLTAIGPPTGALEQVFLLGYEAAASQLVDAPWHPHDPTLGPVGFVRDFHSALAVDTTGAMQARGTGAELDRVQEALAEGVALPSAPAPALRVRDGERVRHEQRVVDCIEQLHAGVLYQANLAHRLAVAPTSREEALGWLADRLAVATPAFAAVVDVPGWGLLLSLSPECFIAWDLADRVAEAWPVKGTRPRDADPVRDAALAEALRQSTKDQAEHVMIVDLLRNDLGKVAAVGGVEVRELMRALTTANVHHLETTIRARLAAGVTLPDLLRATAPGGSITGAPKSTAVEVIHAFEDGPRGAYTGNLGVVDREGRGAASILIRTWLRPDEGEGALHVGGGIVVGSDPAGEWQETLDKASAVGPVRA